MKLGVYTAILHDKPLRGGIGSHRLPGPDRREINAGGFLPTPHLPVDDLLSGAVTRSSTSPRSTAPACRSRG